MIIKQINLENYTTYFGSKSIKIGPRLNIIAGENNHGKTQLYNALHWLVTGENSNLPSRVSEKKVKESSKDDCFQVSVEVIGEQYDQVRSLTRSFTVEVLDDGNIQCGKPVLNATIEKPNGERHIEDGEIILNQMFDKKMVKYLFFKGEDALSETFKNDEALVNLTRNFSGANVFDDFSKKAEELLKKFESVTSKETKKNRSKKAQYEKIEEEINELKRTIDVLKKQHSGRDKELKQVSGLISQVENQIENAEALESSDKIISELKEKISRHQAMIDDAYTKKLFDEKWILYGFEPILDEFSEKITAANMHKREEEHNEIRKKAKARGIEEGKQQGIQELLGDLTPLDVNVPDEQTMEEMIDAQICKVCNREAKEGTDAYAFMKAKLEALRAKQKPKKQEELSLEIEPEPIFPNNFLASLIRLKDRQNDSKIWLRTIEQDISDDFDKNSARKNSLKEYRKDLEKAEENREGIVGSSATSANRLTDNLSNYREWRRDQVDLTKKIFSIEQEIEDKESLLRSKHEVKAGIEKETAISSMIKNQDLMKDITVIMEDTRFEKFRQFGKELEEKANYYYHRINKGGFTGNIAFEVSQNVSGTLNIELMLKQRDKKEIIISTQGKATETSVYLSCMFALSEMASNNDESYPLILDAPISSFGRTKSDQFLQVISQMDFQIILTSKDYTETSENIVRVVPEFKDLLKDMRKYEATATWVNLEQGFDKEQRETLNTKTITL